MKLVSWNVNGLRACAKKGFFDYFQRADADVFCLQETKMQPHQSFRGLITSQTVDDFSDVIFCRDLLFRT